MAAATSAFFVFLATFFVNFELGNATGTGINMNETAAAYQAITSRHVKLWFEETPQYSVALPGDSVFFSCRTNLPITEENVTWVHNGTKYLTRPVGSRMTSAERGGHLTFKVDHDPNNYMKQTGDYRCVAGSRNRFIASLPAKLRIARLGDFELPPDKPETIEAFVGNNVVIACKAPDSIPSAYIQFKRDNVYVSDDEDTSRYQLLNGNTLLIKSVQISDSGSYSCTASNHITDQVKTSGILAVLKVSVTESNEKLKLIYQPEERYTVQVGNDLFIPCGASGYPTPEIIWTRRGNNTPLDSFNGILQLKNVKENNAGSYMCTIFNGSRKYVRQAIVTVLVPPKFTRRPTLDQPVIEGSEVELPCAATGFPMPTIEWMYNGQPISTTSAKVVHSDGILKLGPVSLQDSGIYQCFVSNDVGQNVTGVSLDVRSSGNEDDEEEYFAVSPFVFPESLVTPSKPNLTQLSTDSVMIVWSVPNSTVLPIKFFKIQFREFVRGTRSLWRTVDDVISGESRAFEVLGLDADKSYKFRVVAVYFNNDNKPGPLSRKFRLDPNAGELVSRLKAPSISPEITEVLPLGPWSLRIGWTMNRRAFITRDSVEGYFIYYREKGGPFKKVTIMGSTSHSFIIEKLKPDTAYEVKLRAFNLAGMSPVSTVTRQSTDPSQTSSANMNDTKANFFNGSDREAENKNEPLVETEILQYLITGGALAGSVLVIIACCSAIRYAVKKSARKSLTPEAAKIQDRYLDTSRQISLLIDQRTPTNHIDLGNQRQSGCDTQTSQVFCETSFSSPSLGISEDPFHSSSRWVIDHRSDDELSSSSRNERTSLGEFQEYADEPSRTSWRRTRCSDRSLHHQI